MDTQGVCPSSTAYPYFSLRVNWELYDDTHLKSSSKDKRPVSAWQLGRRMRRKGVASAAGRLSSRRFGRVVGTLAKCYGALAVAALMQKYVVEGMVEGFDAVRGLTGLICFWQLMSILENESTCSDARWAKVARRYLADKAKRHFNEE